MSLPKVVNYMKNVGTSVVYASVENLKEDMPTVAAIMTNESNREIVKMVYAGVKDYKGTIKKAATVIKNSKVYEAANLGVKSAIEDISTGKFYNVERMRKIEEQVSTQVFGDFEDMDISFDDNDDSGFDDVSKGDKLVAASNHISSMKNAEMISNTVAKSAQASIAATEASTNVLYAQQNKLFGELRTDIINIGIKHTADQDKTNKILETISDNSQKFFEHTSNALNEQNAMLKELLEMQRNIYGEKKANNERKEKEKKITIDDVVDSDGVIDLGAWGQSIKTNAKNVLSEKTGGVFDMLNGFGGDANMLTMFTANPLGMATQALLRSASPIALRKAMKDLDKTLSGVAATTIARLNRAANNEDGSPFAQLIGSIFGVKTTVKSSIDPGKFEKGPVPFDGITRATINNGITGYLSRIEAALTGQPAKIYNPQTGRWTTAVGLQKEFEGLRKSSIRSGTGDVADELVKAIFNNKKYKAASTYDKKRIEDNVKSFLETLYNRDGDFKLEKWGDYYDWGVDSEDMFKLMATAMRDNVSRGTRSQSALNVMDARDSLNKRMKDLEDNGSIYGTLFSGAYDKKELRRKDTDPTVSGLAGNLANFKDSKGHDLFFYMQNMYTELYRIRNSVGGSGNIAPTGIPFGTGKQFRELATPIKNQAEKTAKQRKADRERSESIRYNADLDEFVDAGGKVYDLSDGDDLRRVMQNISQEDAVKARMKLEQQGNFFQRALYSEINMTDKINSEREAKGLDSLKGKVLDRFKQASLKEKLDMLMGGVQKFTAVPADLATKTIKKLDAGIYNFFYGDETGEEDEDGNKIKGFMELMNFRLNQTLNKFTDGFEKYIFDPIKKKLGVDSVDDLLEKLGIKQIFNGVADRLLGEKGEDGKRKGGVITNFLDETKNNLKEKRNNAWSWLKDSFSEVFRPIGDRLKSFNTIKEADNVNDIVGSGNVYTSSKNPNKLITIDRDLSQAFIAAGKKGHTAGTGSQTQKEMQDAQFNRNLILKIKSIVLKFKNFPLVLEEMQYGKNKRLFNPKFLYYLKQEKVIDKCIIPMINFFRNLGIAANWINEKDYNEEVRIRMNGSEAKTPLIDGYNNARESAFKILKDMGNMYATTIKERMEIDKQIKEAKEKLDEDNNVDNQQKSKINSALSDRLNKYKERKHKIEFTREEFFELAQQGRMDEYIKHNKFDPKNSALEASASKEDKDKYGFINSFSDNLGKKFKLTEEDVMHLRTIMFYMYDSDGKEAILNLNASDLYNICANNGYQDTAIRIDRAMVNNFSNNDIKLRDVAKYKAPKSIDTIANNIFDSATEQLKKIYALLEKTLPKFSDEDTTDEDGNSNSSPIIRTFRIRRRRESRTSSDNSEGAQSDSEEPPSATAFGGKIIKDTTSALSEGEIYGRNGLFGKVPKTGVYDIKAGTTIYPTKKNKAIELSREQSAIDKYITTNAEANNANTKIVDGMTYTRTRLKSTNKEVWVRYDSDGKAYILEDDGLAARMGNVIKSGVYQITGKVNDDNTKIGNKSLKQISADIRKIAPELSANAILGGAAGLLLGNPLLGAALGASVGFVNSSDKAKNWLFGEKVNEDSDERKGGVIPKDIQDTFKKYMPSISRYGAVGAITGLIAPYGLIGGALLGATAGYVKKNENAQIALFGVDNDPDSGIFSKNLRDTIKKALPNLAVGAVAGMLTGPFGLVGNLVLGSGLGMMSTTEEFKSLMLGEEVDDGNGGTNRVGGLIGTIKTEVVDPFINWGKDFIDDTADFIHKAILQPLADNVPALIHETMHIGGNALSLLPRMINNIFDERFGKPLTAYVTDLIKPVRGLLGGATKIASTVAKGTILLPSTMLNYMGDKVKSAQIRRGDASYLMSAAERNNYRDSHAGAPLVGKFGRFRDDFKAIDKTMAGMNETEIDKSLEIAKNLMKSKSFFKKSLNSKIRTINNLVNVFFRPKDARKIYKLCKAQQFAKAAELVASLPPKDPLKFDNDSKRNLIQQINSCIKDVELLNRKKNLSDEERKNAFKQLEKLGFKGLNDSNLDNFYKSLEKERRVAKNDDTRKSLTPEQKHQDETIDKQTNTLSAKLDTINETLKTILNTNLANSKDANTIEATIQHTEEQHKAAKEAEEKAKKQAENKDNDDKVSSNKQTSADENSQETKKKTKREGFFARIKRKNAATKELDNKYAGNDNENVVSSEGDTAPRRKLKRNGKIREYYDPEANTIRRFSWGVSGWKEIDGKAKTDADKNESSDNEKKALAFLNVFKKFHLKDKVNEETGEKEGGLFSGIKKLLKTGIGILAKGFLAITGVAAFGHASKAVKTTVLPHMKVFWTDVAAPWLEDHIGGRLSGIKDWALTIPEKIQGAFQNAIKWIGENKNKILDWYIDGLKASAGLITGAIKWGVANLPKIAISIMKYGIWPAAKGIIYGIGDIIKNKKETNISDFESTNNSDMDSSPIDTIIDNGKHSADNLGLDYPKEISVVAPWDDYGKLIQDKMPTKTEAETEYKNAKTKEDKAKAVKKAEANAITNPVKAKTSDKIIKFKDNDLMIKDYTGNTLITDENGDVKNTYDNVKSTVMGNLPGSILRTVITGNKGILPAGLKVAGGAYKIAGKIAKKIPLLPAKAVGVISDNVIGTGLQKLGGLADKIPSIPRYLSPNLGQVAEFAGNIMSRSGNETISNIGSKIVGSNFVKFGQEAIQKEAEDAAKKAAEKAAKKAGQETAEKASKGLLSTVTKKVTEAIASFFKSVCNSGVFKKATAEALESAGKEAGEQAVKEATEKMSSNLAKKITSTFVEKIKSATAGLLSRISAALASGKLIDIAFTVVDFISGYNNANSILGVIDSEYNVTFGQKIIAGLLKAFNGFLVWGLVPESLIVDIFLEFVAPIFNINTEQLNAARERSKKAIDDFNAEHGTNYSVESYNKKDKWTTKLKNATIGVFKKTGDIVMSGVNAVDRWANSPTDTANGAYGSMNYSKYGTGRAYQRDPRYSNLPFNKSGDKIRQTIGDSGCGPAAAVNAVNYAYGRGNDLVSAASEALSYKEQNGGTRPEFFDKYFKENGLKSDRLSSTSEIESSIRSGKPTVLMGKDSKGGVATPYGPNPHYITAKGFDRNGNIVVDDPENPNATAIYNKNKVLNNTSVAISASRYGKSKYGRGVDIENSKKIIWSFLIGKGYNEIAASGIMGNIGQECGYDYSLVQKGASNPGLGICQWTYSARKKAFLAAVPNWQNDLMGQLNFFWSEINGDYKAVLPDKLNQCTSVEAAVKMFHDVYERSADATMDKRNRYGRMIYEQFTGTKPVSLPTTLDGATMNSSISNVGSQEQNELSGAISKLVRSALANEYGDTSLGAIFGSNFSSTQNTESTTTSGEGKYGRGVNDLSNKVKSASTYDPAKPNINTTSNIAALDNKLKSSTTNNTSISSQKAKENNTALNSKVKSASITYDKNATAGDFRMMENSAKNSESDSIAKQLTLGEKYLLGFSVMLYKDVPYKEAYLPNSGMNTTLLNQAFKISKKSVSEELSTQTVGTILKKFYGINLDTLYKFAKDLEPYADGTIEALSIKDAKLYRDLKNYVKLCTDTNIGDRRIFIKKTVREIAAEIGISLDGSQAVENSITGDSSDASADSTAATDSSTGSSSSGGLMSIFDILKSAFVGAFDYVDSKTGEKKNLLSVLGIGGGSSSSSSSGTSSDGSYIGIAAPAGLSDAQSKVYKSMKSILGKNEYTQGAARTKVGATLNGESKGYGDCSSTVQWALKQAGVDPGSTTGIQIEASNGKWVDGPYTFDANATPSATSLAVGDLMFYGKEGSTNPRKVNHVEMYFGNNQRVGHGSGTGPRLSDYTAKASYQRYLGAKRFIPVGGSESLETTDSGLGSANVDKGYISSTFNDPTRESHNGIDIAANRGEPVISNINGEIVRSEYNETNGNMVVIKDAAGNLHTFSHLLKPGQSVGTRVKVGSIIGYVGNTGMSSGNHVHVSVSRPDGQFVNPTTMKPTATKRPIGGGTGIDYTSLLKAIMEVLITIADNSAKVDKIIELLANSSNGLSAEQTAAIAATAATKTSSIRDKVNQALGSNGNGKDNIGSILGQKDTNAIIKAMTQIAAE